MNMTGIYPMLYLVIISLALIVLLIAFFFIRDLRSIKTCTLEESYALAKRSKEGGTVIAVIIILDLLVWTVFRSSYSFSTPILLWATIGTDLLFGSFAWFRFMSTALAKRRIRELEANNLHSPSH